MDYFIKWKTVSIKVSCKCDIEIERCVSPYYEMEEYHGGKFDKEFIVLVSDVPQIIWKEEQGTLLLMTKAMSEDLYKAIAVLLNVLIKRVMQEKGMYVLHASSVVIDNRVILMFGSSGSGKTAMALNLGCKKGIAFLSNGSSVVKYEGDSFSVVGTYKTGIKIRKSTLKQYNTTLCNQIFGKSQDENDFDKKVVLLPEQMGMINGEKELRDNNIIELYIIQLDKIHPKIKQNKEYNYKVSMQLYEDLTREIDGAEVYVNIDGTPLFVPSFDNEILFKKRVEFINRFMRDHFEGTVMGGLNEVSDKLISGENKLNEGSR